MCSSQAPHPHGQFRVWKLMSGPQEISAEPHETQWRLLPGALPGPAWPGVQGVIVHLVDTKVFYFLSLL